MSREDASHGETAFISALADLDSLRSDTGTDVTESETLTTSSSSFKRKRTSEVWEHSRLPRATEATRGKWGQELWYCGLCTETSCASVTHATSHLKSKHGIVLGQTHSKLPRTNDTTIAALWEAASVKQLERRLSIDSFDEALARLIAMRNLPFNVVQWPEFRAFCQLLNPAADEMLIQSHSSVPARIASSYNDHRVEVRRVLERARSLIHVTCDMWTGPGHHDFQGFMAHFLDAEIKPRKMLLSLVEQQCDHEGEAQADAQADALWDVVQSFGIRDQVGYFTGDNATSNDNLCASFASKMSNGWDPVERRVRCQGHIINLAVKAFLFGKSGEAIQLSLGRASRQSGPEAGEFDNPALEWRATGAMGKLRNIGAYIRASTRRYNSFKSQAGVALPQEQDTRWNSWYLMLRRAVEVRPFIVAFVEDHFHDLGDDYLSREDWEMIIDTVHILQPFEEATRGLEGDLVTLDRVLPTMDFLIQHIQETQQRYADNRALSASLMNCWLVFDKYYALTEVTPEYAAALLLHPSLKRPYMHRFCVESGSSQPSRRLQSFGKDITSHVAGTPLGASKSNARRRVGN